MIFMEPWRYVEDPDDVVEPMMTHGMVDGDDSDGCLMMALGP